MAPSKGSDPPTDRETVRAHQSQDTRKAQVRGWEPEDLGLDLSRSFGPVEVPKSAAGVRTVAFPASLVPELAHHLAEYASAGRTGLVFVGAGRGRPCS
ncbi:hypothetical protein GCM10011579_018440 [Streptomyces albiflavescens]|uniref:Uncharacterized protein n=1 Tax=Streptomyces albiflavescens TaxID=1623582 RepID=A0A918D1A3_9ACTN|nr:hypothetical protein GCM10011579_018440 [Streptomyces albiflavescens]